MPFRALPRPTAPTALYASTNNEASYRLLTSPGPGVLLAGVPGTLLRIEGVPIYPYKPAEFNAADRARVKTSNELKPYRGFVTQPHP